MTKAIKHSSKSQQAHLVKSESNSGVRKIVHKKIAPDEDDDTEELELNEREVNIASKSIEFDDDDDDF